MKMRLALLVALILGAMSVTTAAAQREPEFRLGFKALADQIPSVVGAPVDSEQFAANGDSLQRTSTGMMVWRKADNWTAFTDGSRTWINGPLGVQDRANGERFRWEMPHPAVEGLSNIYIGAMHSLHTTYSDGSVSYPEGFYSLLKPLWDWAATTDHDFSMKGSLAGEKWMSVIENARRQNDEKFVSFVGFEWTSPNSMLRARSTLGHMSVVFRGYAGLDSAAPSAWGSQYDTPPKLFSYLEAKDGIAAFAHSSSSDFPIDFNNEGLYRNEAVAPLVRATDLSALLSGPVPSYSHFEGGLPRVALERGYRLGFVGELDEHAPSIRDENYQYTGVAADALTRDDIFDGLRARHTYAVSSPYGVGKRILVKASSGPFIMGDAFRADSNPIKLRLQGKTDLVGFRSASLILNGKVVEQRQLTGNEISEDFVVPLPSGDSYLFFDVQAEAGEDPRMSQSWQKWTHALTSPMYVTAGESEEFRWGQMPVSRIPSQRVPIGDSFAGPSASTSGDDVTLRNDSDNYLGGPRNSVQIPLESPFMISLKLKVSGADSGSLVLQGTPTPSAGKAWWEGILRMDVYLRNGALAIGLRDGTTEGYKTSFPLSLAEAQQVSILFEDPQGRVLTILDEQEREIRRIDLTALPGLHMPEGLFPERKLYPGASVSPHSTLLIGALSMGKLPGE